MREFIASGIQTFLFTWAISLAWGLCSLAYHILRGKEF